MAIPRRVHFRMFHLIGCGFLSVVSIVSVLRFAFCILLEAWGCSSLLTSEDNDSAASADNDHQQFSALSTTAVSTLLELIGSNAGNPEARREAFYALPLATFSQAFSPPCGENHRRIAVFIQDEILAKTS